MSLTIFSELTITKINMSVTPKTLNIFSARFTVNGVFSNQ